jgi:dihydrofolate reductase
MKLTTTTQVSVDGVVQGNGGADENRSGGFERGGWARPLFDSEAMVFVDQVYQRADAFLFGRRTYELFAGYWGVREDLGNPIVGALNTKPKYVASNTLTDPKWSDTTVVSGDVAAVIGELKAKPGGELQVHEAARSSAGSSTTSWSTRSPCLSARWSSARARGWFPTTAGTWRLTWWNRELSRRASRSRSTGRPGARSMQSTEVRGLRRSFTTPGTRTSIEGNPGGVGSGQRCS